MNHGLSADTVARLTAVLARFPEVEKAMLYGSRAKGDYRKGSDIDLALFGDGLTEKAMSQIYWALDDLLLPYKIDLSLFSALKHPALIDHIRGAGIALYTRQPAAAEALTVGLPFPPFSILDPPIPCPPIRQRTDSPRRTSDSPPPAIHPLSNQARNW